MFLFIIIDFYRDVNYPVVAALRGVLLLAATSIFVYASRRKLMPKQIDVFSILILSLQALFAFVTAFYGRMPSFFFTNTSITILVFVTTISGLRFRHGFIFNIIYLFWFWFFSWHLQPDPFYFSQYANIFLMFIYSTIAGTLIENRRRKTYLQYEDLLRQKKLTEELNQQKNKIISVLSHDVASPINSLAGLLHLQESGRVTAEEVKPFMKDVRRRLDNVSTLVYGLVRWSRAQLEGFVPEKKVIDMAVLISEIAELFRPAASDKSIQIKIQASKPLLVFTDEEMIRIALRNLVSNAIKFSKADSIVSILAFIKDETVIVKVINKGATLSPGVVEKLFTYGVTSGEGTSGEKGTGLGLAMASYFVKSNGGKIFFEGYDEINETISFVIELPSSK